MAKSSTNDRADLSVHEPLRFVAANTLRSVVVATFGAVLLVTVFRDVIGLRTALLWLAAMTGVGALRLWLRADVDRWPADEISQQRALRQFTACAFASGVIWACAPWVLGTGDDRTLQSVVMFACVAVGAGGAFSSLASLSTAFAILWPPMLAPVLYGLLDGSRYFLVIGGVSLVLGVVLTRLLIALNRQFVEQIELRQRNAQLMLELRQRTADAEAANEAKSRFLVAASHDLRQPMHAIAMRSSALNEQDLSPEARTMADRLDQSVNAMQGLFDALLDISRLDSGVVKPLLAPCDLAHLFHDMADAYHDVAAERGVDLRIDDTTLWVLSDPVLLERMLRQLLDNAMRHAAGSSVCLRARFLGAEVVIEVSDTGKGIPPEQQQNVFKEFVQLDNPQRDRRKGLGLGLSIVERLSRQLGHRVELESELGKGASFSIIAATSVAESTAAAPADPSTRRVAPLLQGLLIALLDDDPDVLEAMSMLMTRWRCDVVAATHSDELAERLRGVARKPDLLICDYRLAEPLNGREVIEALRREFGRDIPAFLITGDIHAIATIGDELGITVLKKPVRPVALREIIAAHTKPPRTEPSAS